MLVEMSSVLVSMERNMDFYLKRGGGYELPVFEPESITYKTNILFTVPSLYPCDMILEPPEGSIFWLDLYMVSVNCNIHLDI